MIKERKKAMLYAALLSIYVVIFLGYYLLTEFTQMAFSRTVFFVLMGFFFVDALYVFIVLARVPKKERIAAYKRYQYQVKDPDKITFDSYHEEDTITFLDDRFYSAAKDDYFSYDQVTLHAFIVDKVPYEVINLFIEINFLEASYEDGSNYIHFELTEPLYQVLKYYNIKVARLDEILFHLKKTLNIETVDEI